MYESGGSSGESAVYGERCGYVDVGDEYLVGKRV